MSQTQSLETKSVAEQATTPMLTRKVRVLYKSCCGCGCYDYAYDREVPFDSPLKDGDYVKQVLPTDKEVRS